MWLSVGRGRDPGTPGRRGAAETQRDERPAHVVGVAPEGLVASSTAPKARGAMAPAPKPSSERSARPEPR